MSLLLIKTIVGWMIYSGVMEGASSFGLKGVVFKKFLDLPEPAIFCMLYILALTILNGA